MSSVEAQRMGAYRIPFNRPTVVGTELAYVSEVLAGPRFAGGGDFGRRCEDLLEVELGVARAMVTTSCTHALELAALVLRIQPGDEVIMPSFTFASTANAFVLRGARPVFADIRADTLNIDDAQLERLVTDRTRAVVPVHYAGIACAMDEIMGVADLHGFPVVEDNAHGLFGSYKGRPLGAIGTMATLSFHDTKNVTCGEGGALVFNDASLVELAEIVRDKGTDRAQFVRGETKRYSWRDIGSSYMLSEFLAAVLYAQLDARHVVQAKRQHVWNRYRTELAEWSENQRVQLPVVPSDCVPAYHLFHMVLPTGEDRLRLIEHLKDRGIQASWHYTPLHSSDMGRRLGADQGRCPVSDSVASRLLRLPFYTSLNDDEQTEIIAAVSSWAS
jgi:dTDP-4-amino-4,6-dideoxygalactose transaminase